MTQQLPSPNLPAPSSTPAEPSAPADHATAPPVPRSAAAAAFREAGKAPATLEAYQSAWSTWLAWCEQTSTTPLPADPQAVANFIAAAASTQHADGSTPRKASTLTRWVAAINYMHEYAGHIRPGAHPAVREVLSGIRRTQKHAPRRAKALTLKQLRRAVDRADCISWPVGVAGRRDQTIFLLGFAGAFRASELTALEVRDIDRDIDQGVRLRVRTSKTDQAGEGAWKAIPYGQAPETCPVCALVRWLQLVEASRSRQDLMRALGGMRSQTHVCRGDWPDLAALGAETPLLRAVTKAGRITDRPLSGDAINAVVKRRLAKAEGSADGYSSHSLRAGFVTAATTAGATPHEVVRQTQHADPRMIEVYSREHSSFDNNAVTRIGL